MIITSHSSALALLLRYHQFIKTSRRGSRDEIAAMLGVGKNKLTDLRRILTDRRCYEYLNDFDFYVGPAKRRA